MPLRLPLLWRYLLRSYLETLLLALLSFIAILLVIQCQEVARFASSGASITTIFLFTLYQIPYVLPLALPISSLIASFLLMQKISRSSELTTLRALGLSLPEVSTPILLAGALLAALNFLIASEITPRARGSAKHLLYDMAAKSPLFLFQKGTLLRCKDVYMEIGELEPGKGAKDLKVVVRGLSHGRLALAMIERAEMENSALALEGVHIISSWEAKGEEEMREGFDHLFVESEERMVTNGATLVQMLYPNAATGGSRVNEDYLPSRMLWLDAMAKEEKLSDSKSLLELARRLSLGLAAFSFTALGTLFGIDLGRSEKMIGAAYAALLTGGFLALLVAARSMHHLTYFGVLLNLIGHPLLLAACVKRGRSIASGGES